MNEALKVMLWHARTGYYYRSSREWVMSPSEARDFRRTERALEVAAKEGLEGMTVVLRHDTGREEVFSLHPAKATV
jgi:hypothetical protein